MGNAMYYKDAAGIFQRVRKAKNKKAGINTRNAGKHFAKFETLRLEFDGNTLDTSRNGADAIASDVTYETLEDGSNVIVTTANSNITGTVALADTTNFVLEIKFYITSMPTELYNGGSSSPFDQENVSFIFIDDDGVTGYDLHLVFNDDGKIYFVTKDGDSLTTADGVLTTGIWYTIRFSANADEGIKQIAVNDIVVAQKTWSGYANIGHHYKYGIGVVYSPRWTDDHQLIGKIDYCIVGGEAGDRGRVNL